MNKTFLCGLMCCFALAACGEKNDDDIFQQPNTAVVWTIENASGQDVEFYLYKDSTATVKPQTINKKRKLFVAQYPYYCMDFSKLSVTSPHSAYQKIEIRSSSGKLLYTERSLGGRVLFFNKDMWQLTECQKSDFSWTTKVSGKYDHWYTYNFKITPQMVR